MAMDSKEMAVAILEIVRSRRNVSFAEIVNMIGDDARGDVAWEAAPNIVLWTGMSQSLVHAFEILKDKIEPHPTSVLIYLMDGAALRLPVAKRLPRAGYKQPRWLPVAFSPRIHVDLAN
ncbi:MAG: hypothetical protein ABSF22_21060 [Bryobacteraceae bacterium]|jgi:hypothetical protein